MPIQNLTDQNTLNKITRQLPRAGVFWKGDPKENGKMGKDRTDGSWRIEWDEGFDYAREAFEFIFPSTAVPIVIATIGNTVESCLDDYYRLYGGNNAIKRLCDGCSIKFAALKSEIGQDCICAPIREKDPKAKDLCVAMGYFRFTIPQLNIALNHQLQFQFNITSTNELQQFAKELEATLQAQGKLVNEVFLLQRNDRSFNLSFDGQKMSKTEKSLAYLVAFPFDLDKRTNPVEALPAATQTKTPHALPSGDVTAPVAKVEAKIKEDYFKSVSEWVLKHLGYESVELFVQRFTEQKRNTLEELYADIPDIEKFRSQLIQYVVNRALPIRIYGCVTQQFNNSGKKQLRHLIPFGFGSLYSYTREDYHDDIQKQIRGEYIVLDMDGNPTDNVTNTGVLGAHPFNQIFDDTDYLNLFVDNSDNGLKIIEIMHPTTIGF